MANLTAYISILTAVSIIAPFAIEAIKKLLGNKNYNVNTLSAVTTAVFALVACVAYMVVTKTYPTPENVTRMIGVVFFSILGALCGYDKIFKAIFEIFKVEE